MLKRSRYENCGGFHLALAEVEFLARFLRRMHEWFIGNVALWVGWPE